MKILVCFGTRPEAIKMAPLCYALKDKGLTFKVCVTAQHREMLDQVLDFFDIKPDFDLNLMAKKQSLNQLSARIISAVDNVLEKENFDLILVHGDTTTSAMVSLAAFHRGIKVGHVEAGLRTNNKYAPFPEEINRQLTARLSDFHFAPTDKAYQNLINENIPVSHLFITGNTIVDALYLAKSKIEGGFTTNTIQKLKKGLDFTKKIILVTGHRRENFGENLKNICSALINIAKNDDVEIIFPVHLNPNVKDIVYKLLAGYSNIMLLEPLDYPSFVWLLSKSSLVISDSGGIQEEAPCFGVHVLVTRNVTERPEGIKSGHSFLVGASTSKIIEYANMLLRNKKKMTTDSNPYGDGTAAKQIASLIKYNF